MARCGLPGPQCDRLHRVVGARPPDRTALEPLPGREFTHSRADAVLDHGGDCRLDGHVSRLYAGVVCERFRPV